ncbi:MAG: polysaccharide biosynthesis tyrosine autokinase [Acidimicrobiales bacterium]
MAVDAPSHLRPRVTHMPTSQHGPVSELDVVGGPNPLTLARVKAMTRRQWWVVVVVALAAAAGAAGYTELRPAKYLASEAIYTGAPGAAAGQATSVPFPGPAGYATGPRAVQAAASAAGLPPSKIALSASLSSNGTEIVISATEPGVDEAIRGATAAGKAFISSWTTQLNALASSNAPQLAALSHQLQSLTAQYAKGGGAARGSPGAPTTSTAPPTTGPGAAPATSPLAAEIQVVTAQYSSLYSQELQYRVAAQSIRLAQTGAPPVSTVPGGKAKVILIALGAGFLAGCGLGLARDLARDKLSDPSELPSLSELPLLAELPTARVRRKWPLTESFEGRLGEAARELRTAVALTFGRRALSTLLVTSAGNGEGKSFTAANLAIAFGLSGARTVLVSSDLRHPNVGHMLGAQPSSTGLAQWVSGQASHANGNVHLVDGNSDPLDALLRPTPIERLKVLPPGAISANPAEYLGSQGMADLVEELRRHFDMVIFDSPPVLAVTDALVLSRYAEGVLFVVASEQSSKRNVNRALGLLERSRANMLGVVLNRAARSGLRSYRYASYAPKLNGAARAAIEARTTGPLP